MVERTGKMQRELLSVRDTVESIWVAIILAFILRAFMVEAFVIPTGSMAPRLLGQHYDLQCTSCGWEFSYTTPSQPTNGPRRENAWEKDEVFGARCPNCGKGYEGPKQFSNGGDRVLVMKFLYNFAPPRPWDVVVFRNPQDNEQNYIKRLIGVPGETIQIVQGDVFVKADRDDRFYTIRRKGDPHVQEAMWQIVYDNDYRPDAARLANPAAPRWSKFDEQDPSWDLTGGEGRHFLFNGSGPGAWRWIRFGANPDADRFLTYTRELFLPRYGYNAYVGEPNSYFPGDPSRLNYGDVCSDLKLSARFVPGSAHARLSMLLTSFRNAFRADVSADGAVKLYHARIPPTGDRPGEADWRELAAGQYGKPLSVGQGYQVALTHVDYRVTVWVDGVPVAATGDRDYTAHLESDGSLVKLLVSLGGASDVVLAKSDYMAVGAMEVPTPSVQLAASGGACRLEHVQLYRDVYYTGTRLAMSGRSMGSHAMDYSRKLSENLRPGADPSLGWGVMGNPITLQVNRLPYPNATAGDPDLDSFFVLGDNSPSSLDSRAWIEAATTLRLFAPGDPKGENSNFLLYQLGTVPRYNMIGKALFVYWPSGHRLPGLPVLPIVPNVGRMRLVR